MSKTNEQALLDAIKHAFDTARAAALEHLVGLRTCETATVEALEETQRELILAIMDIARVELGDRENL